MVHMRKHICKYKYIVFNAEWSFVYFLPYETFYRIIVCSRRNFIGLSARRSPVDHNSCFQKSIVSPNSICTFYSMKSDRKQYL